MRVVVCWRVGVEGVVDGRWKIDWLEDHGEITEDVPDDCWVR